VLEQVGGLSVDPERIRLVEQIKIEQLVRRTPSVLQTITMPFGEHFRAELGRRGYQRGWAVARSAVDGSQIVKRVVVATKTAHAMPGSRPSVESSQSIPRKAPDVPSIDRAYEK
jgi:hypothetical protein